MLNPELLTGTLKTINFQRERSIKVITASWRKETTVQYQPCLMKRIEFCKKKKKGNVISPDLPVVLDLLNHAVWEWPVLQHCEHSKKYVILYPSA